MAHKKAKTKQKSIKSRNTEVSCKVAKALINHIENRADSVQAEKFFNNIEHERNYLDHDFNWISYEKLRSLLKSAAGCTEDSNVSYKIGQNLMHKDILDSLHYILKSHHTPKHAYKELPDFFSHIHKLGELEVKNINHNGAEVHFSYHLRHAPDQNVCALNAGILSAIPKAFNEDHSHVEETHCSALGHPKCIYKLKWDTKVKEHHHWFQIGTIAGIFAGMVLLGLHKNVWTSLSPLALSLTFIIPSLFGISIGKLIEQSSILKSLRKQIKANRKHLSKLHHRTVKKHYEIEHITSNISAKEQRKILELMRLNEQLVSEKETMHQLREREEQICRNIQQSVLISPEDLSDKTANLDGSVIYHTADYVGGDFYDVHEDNKGSYLLIGDVSGHGLGSVQIVHSAISYFRAIGKKHQADKVVQALNNYLKKDLSQSINYVTAIYCHIHDGTLKYVNAGHRSGFIYKVDTGKFHELESAKQILGAHFSNNKHLKLRELPLDKNDLIILTTDGLIEAKNQDLKEFGHERLHKIVETLYRPDPQGEYPHPDIITGALLASVDEHAHNLKDDDVTVLIFKNK